MRVQAIVPHTTGTNRTLLRFDPGDVITVLMPEAQNGWLYGKLEGSSTYVRPWCSRWAWWLARHLSCAVSPACWSRRSGGAGRGWTCCLGRLQGPGDTSWLARLSESCSGSQLRTVNCRSYLRGLVFLSSSAGRAWKLLLPALTELLLPAGPLADTCWQSLPFFTWGPCPVLCREGHSDEDGQALCPSFSGVLGQSCLDLGRRGLPQAALSAGLGFLVIALSHSLSS